MGKERLKGAFFGGLFLFGHFSSSLSAVESKPVRIVFVGDIMLDRIPGKFIAAGKDPFSAFASVLDSADIRVGNLECVMAPGGKQVDKHFVFNADPKAVSVLTKHFDAVSLANNHTGDFGHEALVSTLELLKKNHLNYFGAGRDLKEAHTPWIVEKNGIKIAILGYNEFRPRSFEAGPHTPGVAWSDDASVIADIQEVRPKVDLVLTFMHWGEEYYTHPNDRQRALARKMIDSGADIVIGGHPHVTEGAETYRGKLIVYSLGNFVFDDFIDNLRDNRFELDELSRTGWVLSLVVDKKGLLHWETLVSRTGEDGFPMPVIGAKGPSSESPYDVALLGRTGLTKLAAEEPPAPDCKKSQGMQRCLNGKLQAVNLELIRLGVGRGDPKGPTISELATYTHDAQFLKSDALSPNPQRGDTFTQDQCRLSRFDYNVDFAYPDPQGFNMGIKSLLLSTDKALSLEYPLRSQYRDAPDETFDHKRFTQWISSGKKIKLQGVVSEVKDNFETSIGGVPNFKVRTDAQLTPGEDFHLGIVSPGSSDRALISFGGYDTNRNKGYHLVCDFPVKTKLSFLIPGALTAQIPKDEVPQKQVALAVELYNVSLVDSFADSSFMVRVIASNRLSQNVPLATSPMP